MLHCNGIDPFVMLMGNFNWGPISRNDIVSNVSSAVTAPVAQWVKCWPTDLAD